MAKLGEAINTINVVEKSIEKLRWLIDPVVERAKIRSEIQFFFFISENMLIIMNIHRRFPAGVCVSW